MKGTITLELETETQDSGSGMPDLGHDAYWLMKELPKLIFKDTNGKEKPIGDKYKIIRVATEAE